MDQNTKKTSIRRDHLYIEEGLVIEYELQYLEKILGSTVPHRTPQQPKSWLGFLYDLIKRWKENPKGVVNDMREFRKQYRRTHLLPP